MKWQPPIPAELWDQVPPAAQAAILALILQYEQQLRGNPAASTAAGPPPLPGGPRFEPDGETSPLAEMVGKTIAHFELGPMIAAGNTGAIFKAKDTTLPGRKVAFQILRPELCRDEDKERYVKTMSVV